MARPKRAPYENLDHSKVLVNEAPLHLKEHLSGESCPKVKGTWLWTCSNPRCEHAEGGAKPLYLPEKCSRRGCVICSKSGDKKRGDNLLERLGGKGIGIWVFTLPRPYDRMLSGPTLKELERRFRARLEHLYLKDTGYRIGYRQIWHPSGDHCHSCGYEETTKWKPSVSGLHECPQCGVEQQSHPHMNFIIPLNGWDMTTDDPYEKPVMRKMTASISSDFLLKVKKAWAQEVTRCFQAFPELKLPPMIVRCPKENHEHRKEDIKNGRVCVANCHYQFVKQVRIDQTKKVRKEIKNQLKHRMSYFARSFPAWEESFKTVLHRGRDYGILTNVSRGNTAAARKKYRESIIFVDPALLESGGEVIEGTPDLPGCFTCIDGTLSERSYHPKYRQRSATVIAGPFYNDDGTPYMERVTCRKQRPKLLLSSGMNVSNASPPSGHACKTASSMPMRLQKRPESSSGTCSNALVS